jgi:hypothetical protein
LRVQCLLREKLVDRDLACQALNLTRSQKTSLEEALESLEAYDWSNGIGNNRLGQLLIEGNAITDDELTEGLGMAACTGLPLGRVLVISGLISEDDLSTLVHLQLLLRQGSIQRQTALEEIACLGKDRDQSRNAPDSSPKSAGSILSKHPVRQQIAVEELLVRSGVISQSALAFSIQECAIVCKQPEQVLLDHGFVDRETVEAATRLSVLVNQQQLELIAAIQELNKFITAHRFNKMDQLQMTGRTPWRTTATGALPQAYPQDLVDFLVLCNVVTGDQRSRARQMRSGTSLDEIAVLLRIHVVAQIDVDIASLCYQCVQDSVLTLDQAIFANRLFATAVNSGKLTFSEIAQALRNPAEFSQFAKQYTNSGSAGAAIHINGMAP